MSFLGTLWGKIVAGLVALAAAAGAIAVWIGGIRRRAREEAERRIQVEEFRRELKERRIVDDVEADVAGLDARERRERLRRYSRN